MLTRAQVLAKLARQGLAERFNTAALFLGAPAVRGPEMAAWIAHVSPHLLEGSPLHPDELRRLERLQALYATQAPWMLEEVAAIAQAAGQDEHAIAYRLLIGAPQPGCTVIGVPPALTRDGHTLLGRNYDYALADVVKREGLILPDHGYALFGHLIWGVGLADGLNEAGLAMALAAMPVRLRSQPTIGLNMAQAVRVILHDCATVNEALCHLPALNVRGGWQFVLADRSGAVALVEINGSYREIPLARMGGAALATNLALDHEFAAGGPPHGKPWAIHRYETLHMLVDQARGRIDPALLIAWLTGEETALYARGDLATIWTAVYDATALTVQWHPAYAWERSPFLKLALTPVFNLPNSHLRS